MAHPVPLKTFVIYARADEGYKQQLLLHLRPLVSSRLLSVWHDGNILPGEDWEKAIKKELKSSDLVLVLVSAHSLNSEFIQTQELRTALDRLRDGLTRVVPVIVSPCGWKFDPVLAGLQALPLYGGEGPKPVNDRVWQSTDEAWASVIDHLGEMVLELHRQRGAVEREAQLAAEETARWEAADRLVRQQQEQAKREAAKEAEHRQAVQQRIDNERLEKEQARHHIKTLRQEDRRPVTWGKWAGIAGVLLVAWVAAWMLTRPGPQQAPSPEATIEKIGGIDYPMVRVVGGIYTMGSPDTEVGRSADECQHSVSVATFNIGQTEVTQAQWQAVMGSNPSDFKGDSLPVGNVSWDDVQVFIKKLNALTGKNFRLPTEEEWEYAARGGNRSGGYKYAGSDNLEEVAWYGYEKVGRTTHPVATKKANELGLYDMSGNVGEWCQDLYGPYPGCSEPKSLIDLRVVRGGAWFDNPDHCRAAYRVREDSDLLDYVCGLRLAR